MHTQVVSLEAIPHQNQLSLPEEFEKFALLRAHLSQAGELPEKKGEAILFLLNKIHDFLYEVGVQGNTEVFLNQLHEVNQVIEDIIRGWESHMYDDIHFALDLFMRRNSESTLETIAQEVFSSVDTVLAT